MHCMLDLLLSVGSHVHKCLGASFVRIMHSCVAMCIQTGEGKGYVRVNHF